MECKKRKSLTCGERRKGGQKRAIRAERLRSRKTAERGGSTEAGKVAQGC